MSVRALLEKIGFQYHSLRQFEHFKNYRRYFLPALYCNCRPEIRTFRWDLSGSLSVRALLEKIGFQYHSLRQFEHFKNYRRYFLPALYCTGRSTQQLNLPTDSYGAVLIVNVAYFRAQLM